MKKGISAIGVIVLAVLPGGIWAQVGTYYYQGKRKVQVAVRTDALSVKTTGPITAATKAQIGVALPVGAAGAAEADTVLVKTQARDFKELNTRAEEIDNAAPGVRVRPVLQPGENGDPQNAQVLTDQISFKLNSGKNAAPQAALAGLASKYGLSDVKELPYAPGTYVATVNDATADLLAPLTSANRMQESGEAVWAAPLLLRQQMPRTIPNDPFFPNQWHLKNDGTNTTQGLSGNDLNVAPAWDTVTGAGVNVAITDDGVETSHTDLLANARTDIDYDFNGPDDDPAPLPAHGHGTACAGVTAGKGNNGIGISGVAPDAGIVGLRLIAKPTTDLQEATALGWKVGELDPANQVAVNSNSWGPTDSGSVLEGPGPITESAMETAVTMGRNGKGVVFSWAAGNGRLGTDNINKDGYANSPFVIAVGATNSAGTVSYYSEPGAPMLVNAPSNHSADGIFTTDNSGAGGADPTDYRNNFGGTSSAAPAVAGAVALMLEANPNLTYRDVMHILVDTAVKNDAANPSWVANGAGRFFSHNYGFGRVDAAAAVAAAVTWENVPPAVAPIEIVDSLTTGVVIPDSNPAGVTFEFPVAHATPFFTEHVELEADIQHTYRGDLSIRLVSPSGMVSELINKHFDPGNDYSNWRFRSVAHWGESPVGTWKVIVADNAGADVGVVNSLTLRVRGYEIPASAVDEWENY